MVREPWHGFQVVEIEGWFGSELLVFQSRDQPAFYARVRRNLTRCPNNQKGACKKELVDSVEAKMRQEQQLCR
jgi:hypothetical protein